MTWEDSEEDLDDGEAGRRSVSTTSKLKRMRSFFKKTKTMMAPNNRMAHKKLW